MNQGFNQPPVMFQLPCIPGVERITPLLITEVANAVGNSSNKNHARQYIFNQMASNGWNNQEFKNLCELAMNMLCLQLSLGRMQNPEQGVFEIAQHAALLVTSYAIINDMQLNAYVNNSDPSVLHEAQNRVRELAGIVQGIERVRNGGGNFNNQPRGQVWGNNAGQQVGNPFNPSMMGGVFSNNNSGGFSQNGSGGRWAANANTTTMPEIGTKRIFDSILAPKETQSPKTENNKVKTLVWKQSPEQRYPQAFNTSKEKLVLEQTTFHGSEFVKSTVIEMENSMDRKLHQMSAAASAHYVQVPVLVEDRAETTATSVRRYASEVIPSIDDGEFKDIVIEYALSYDKAINDTRVIHISESGADYEKSIRVCTWDIPYSFATFESTQSVLNELGSCTTFKELVVKMAYLGKINTRLIMEVDAYLTKKLNSMLANEFSLHSLRADSFMDDAAGLRDYLMKKEGVLYSDAFDKIQSSFIGRYLNVPTDDDAVQFKTWMCYPATENAKVEVTPVFFEHQVAVISLGIHSAELNIGTYIHPTTKRMYASQIAPSSLPMLHELVETVFMSHYKQGVDLTTALIVTGDNKMFELYRGRIGGNAYLIRPC